MTTGLHHVEIYVSDLAASLEFWDWLLIELGYAEYESWDGGRSYKQDRTYLVFVQAEPDFAGQRFHRKRPGLNHLAFWAPSADWVADLPDRLRERGVRVLYTERGPGEIGAPSEWAVFFEDPDRIKVEVITPEST